MSDTLILNSDGNPLSMVPLSSVTWQEAIKLLYLKKVIAVKNYDNWHVHSSKTVMTVPSVIITKKFYNTATKVKFSRANILLRDEYTCQYCGCELTQNNFTLDHLVPRSKMGRRSWTNLCVCCKSCNYSRGDDTSIQPLRRPYKPTYYELSKLRRKFPITMAHTSWQLFLNWDESLVTYAKNTEDIFNLDDLK
jgi:5-methylcytosine-specific restriction endonuclease McrA